MRRGIGHPPLADQAMAAIRRDMVLVPEQRDRQIDLALAVLARLGLGVLDRPPSIAILLPEPSGLVRHTSGMRPSLIACFSAFVVRCLGAATMLASTSCPAMAR